MTDQQRIDNIFARYCISIKSKHEAYDFLRAERSMMSPVEVELFETTLTEERTRERLLEDLASELYGVDLWQMWLDEPLTDEQIIQADLARVEA